MSSKKKRKAVIERPRNPYPIRKRSDVIPDKRQKQIRNRHLDDMWMAKKLKQELKEQKDDC